MGKTKPIPVRLSENSNNLVRTYAAFKDISISKALRELIKEGLYKKAHVGLLKRLEEDFSKRNPLVHMNGCDKCNSHKDVRIYHIDGNIRNFIPQNLALLCVPCVKQLKEFMQKYNPREKFVTWFYLSE